VGNHIIKKTSKANFPFEIIYSDVIGMITKIIYGKKGTYLTFIDEYTRKSWIFLLKKKKKKKKKNTKKKKKIKKKKKKK